MSKDEPKILKELKEENQKLQNLCNYKSEAVSYSVHQIRTSLSALKWIIKMFLDGDLGKLSVEQANLLQKAYEGNDRAINLASELLRINKTEEALDKKTNYEGINLEEMISETVFDFSGEARIRGIEIIFLRPTLKIRHAYTDRDKIRVVLQNLVENAIKYSNMHGKIFITLQETEGGMIQVSVKDTGIVISEEGKKRLFEKFYRDPTAGKREVMGSGIGLYTTKKIVEENSGKIWFESTEKEGTTFYFTVPVVKN